ncbi:CAP domain-containing protein [Streptomyces sp. NBC_00078]|uniref:CAP domain-containing protein n=1 Tax=unclassified Streptomyces TaxID=2593676 RepID=UPI0022548748|nr:CAP domain-containing protein [Streptomyces sp. NBC_00078]MCX5423942.1 CAP domain-containing protein [Streptomyces sp. NBC_00078]
MGRHRRSAAGRAATGRATGVTGRDGSHTSSYDPRQYSYSYDPPEAQAAGDERPVLGIAPYLNSEEYAESSARSAAYLFATEDDYATVFPEHGPASGGGSGRGGSRRRKKRAATPVKTGLLGVSAAVAIGTVAVATGSMPGLDNYKLGGGGGDKVQAASTPTNSASEQGGTSGSVRGRDGGSSTSRDADRSASPSPSPSTSTSTAAPTEAPTKKPTATPSKKPKTTPSKKETKPPKETTAPVTVSAEAAAEAEVLKLVNEQRAKVGCSAVAANSTLSDLAETFSKAMAADDFFDHTDPSGATPWDRASKLGISNLGGENIARGQADAAAVMEAWMNSPGHRANILNCDFKTLGVGVHFGTGGPWWTQDFGY